MVSNAIFFVFLPLSPGVTSFRSVQLQHAARKAVAVPVSDGCCARSVGWDAVGKKSICQEGAPCPNLILLGSSQLAQRVPWVCRVGRRFFGWGKGYQVKGGGFGWKGCIYIYIWWERTWGWMIFWVWHGVVPEVWDVLQEVWDVYPRDFTSKNISEIITWMIAVGWHSGHD